MDRVEIVAYRTIVSVDLRGPALPNGHLANFSIHDGKNDYNKTGRQEVDPLSLSQATNCPNNGGKLRPPLFRQTRKAEYLLHSPTLILMRQLK